MRVSRVRPQHRLATWIACALALAVFVAPLSLPQAHAQDAVSQARDHYKRGNDLFAKGDYEAAIAEFAQADNLAPSATLEFNIALCYDRLGDRPEALRRYELYLREVPRASNRATVEAKIRRIQGELRQESEARDSAAAREAAVVEPTPPVEQPDKASEVTGGLTPTYSPPAYEQGAYDDNAAANDPELARVAAIDVAAIHNERGAGSGYEPGAGMANEPGEQDLAPKDKGKKSKPIYKQWWFWVVAGVSAVILIDFAFNDSSSSDSRLIIEPQNQSAAPSPNGLEWRF